MSLIATANPPAKGAEGPVGNDGFFPDVDRSVLRTEARFDGTVTPERLREAIYAAMWDINGQLERWKAEQLEKGFGTLADVPAPSLDGESVKVRQYRRAIKCHVQAQVVDAYRDMSTLPQGAGKEARVTTGVEIRVDGFNQQLRWAIADLMGNRRVIAELL